MRNIILILAFLLTTVNICSQDSEPTPWNFVWGHSSAPRPFEPDTFKQECILTGFQWSGSKNMNNALRNKARAAVNINLVFTN